MITSIFSQFESYVAAVEDADLEMMLPRLQAPYWEISAFSVGKLHLQFGREGSGNITQGSSRPGGQVIFIPLTGLHRANGVPLNDRSVFLMQPGREFTISVQEEHHWCSLFVPWQLTSGNADERPLCEPQKKSCCVVEWEGQQMSRLRRVLMRLTRAVEIEPKILTERSARLSVERDLAAICRLRNSPEAQCDESIGRPRLPRRDLIQMVRELMDQQIDEGLTIEDLAAATDVSERTLRNVFVEQFGMPPKSYFLTHRLHRVRSVLCASDPNETTVTAVAAEFGFWHFGRFAGDYRRLFGESPSATLHKNTGQRVPAFASK